MLCREGDELTDEGLLPPVIASDRLGDLVYNGIFPGNLAASPGQVHGQAADNLYTAKN